MSTLIAVRGVTVNFRTTDSRVRALDNVSLTIEPGQTVAIVGESGSGKSTLARALVGLVEIDNGIIEYRGEVLAMGGKRLRPVGTMGKMQMVFQDPSGSLDPRMRVGDSIEEVLKVHSMLDPGSRDSCVKNLLEAVGLPAAIANMRPRQLSGGQRQRIAIARALAVEPELLICDEPLSALDVSISAQILHLLDSLQRTLGIAYMFITHDMSAVRRFAERVYVTYRGRIVEAAQSVDLFRRPLHPYTYLLIDSVPAIDGPRPQFTVVEEEATIRESTSSKGCSYAPRCPYARALCYEEVPKLEVTPNNNRLVACHVWRTIMLSVDLV